MTGSSLYCQRCEYGMNPEATVCRLCGYGDLKTEPPPPRLTAELEATLRGRTIGQRLRQMERDLAELASKLNTDGSPEEALQIQGVLAVLANARNDLGDSPDFDWTWVPMPPEEENQ